MLNPETNSDSPSKKSINARIEKIIFRLEMYLTYETFRRTRMKTYHNGDEMSVVIRERSITSKGEMLSPQEMFQIRWVR